MYGDTNSGRQCSCGLDARVGETCRDVAQLGEKTRKGDVIVRQATMSVLVIADLREGTK